MLCLTCKDWVSVDYGTTTVDPRYLKSGPEVIKPFSCSTQFEHEFFPAHKLDRKNSIISLFEPKMF